MPLTLPTTFAFSQSSLQAYADCSRRFWLAYVQRLPWPAVEAGPVHTYEQQSRLGSAFHQLLHRAESGLELDLLAQRLSPPLDGWFDAYRRHRPDSLPAQHVETEHVLSIPFGSPYGRYRLAAQYDLIAAEGKGERVVIVDWKTGSRPTRRSTLQWRLQTIVYPFVLVEASGAFPWGPVEPEQVEMVYWFTAAPDSPEIFRYSADQHAANRSKLQQMLSEILSGTQEVDFPLVPDTEQNRRRLCAYCVYRSRCDRGEVAGVLDLQEEIEFFAVDLERALEFTLDEVEELAF